MKTFLLFCMCVCFIINSLCAQNSPVHFIKNYKQKSQCITLEQQNIINARVKQNIELLRREGRLNYPPNESSKGLIKLSWPLKPASNFTDSFYYVESNFVDHDPSTGLQDWNCGMRTYDGHQGTDISLWPFPWLMMDNKEIKVVAAAQGIIVDKHDGAYDRNCYGSSDMGNYVILRHANGVQTEYYHLKKGSVTSKTIGSSVANNETLGYVGSSGNAQGVHLHFGVYDSLFNVLDPYKGTCNNSTSVSLWKNQPVYWGRSIHKIMVTTVPTIYPDCPNPEQINEYPTVPLGLNGYFFAFLSEIKQYDTVYAKIIKPNGSVWRSFAQGYDIDYIFAYDEWELFMDTTLPTGIWKWQVTLNHKTVSYDFTVTSPLSTMKADNNYTDENDVTAIPPHNADSDNDKMIVSPNPAKNKIQIQLNVDAGEYHLELLNAKASVIKQQQVKIIAANTSETMYVNGIQPGVYQLRMYNQSISISKTVILQ